MARPKDPKLEQARREQVLDATITLLEQGSWKGTTLAAVAHQAGVSKGMVTYWFADKDALLVAAIDRYHDRTAERLVTVVASGGSVEARLRTLLEVAFPSVDAVAAEVAFQAEVMSYAKERPEVAARLRAAYTAFRQVTDAVLQAGRAEGFVTRDQPGTARMVHALIDGLSLQVAADPDADLPALRDQLAAHLDRWLRDSG